VNPTLSATDDARSLYQALGGFPILLISCEFVSTKLGQNLVLLKAESGVIAMKPSQSIKPISFLKTHTADVVRDVNENRETVIITQNGEARAIVQDIATYEQTQETLALLKLLAQGKRSIEQSRSRPFRKAIKELRAELAKTKA
jgi:prevent-host-death family protein